MKLRIYHRLEDRWSSDHTLTGQNGREFRNSRYWATQICLYPELTLAADFPEAKGLSYTLLFPCPWDPSLLPCTCTYFHIQLPCSEQVSVLGDQGSQSKSLHWRWVKCFSTEIPAAHNGLSLHVTVCLLFFACMSMSLVGSQEFNLH